MASTDSSFKDESKLGNEATKHGVQQLRTYDPLADEMKVTLETWPTEDSKAV